MKIAALIFVALAGLAGCSGLSQQPYTGPVDVTPELGFRQARILAPCSAGSTLVCVQTVTSMYVTNAYITPQKYTIQCDDLSTMYADEVVPARTTKWFSVSNEATKCWIASRGPA